MNGPMLNLYLLDMEAKKLNIIIYIASSYNYMKFQKVGATFPNISRQCSTALGGTDYNYIYSTPRTVLASLVKFIHFQGRTCFLPRRAFGCR